MSVTLYYGSGSAYAWRIWLALEHKSVPYELKLLSFSDGDLKTPEYTVLNPRQRVPTLVHDGLAYRESAAIMEYVEERWPEPPLFARDLRLRAEQRRIVREADNYVADAVEHLFAAVFAPPEKADAVKLAQAVTALKDEIARWEPELKADYLTGDGVSVADYTLYPHLAIIERFRLRRPDAIPADLFPPRMAAWMERMKALPLIRKTWPPHWKS
jgi:glutathione S-transferase